MGTSACASIPRQRYGIERVTFSGVEAVNEHALRACLASHARPHFAIRTSDPTCGEPPFAHRSLYLPLWRWPWTDWPLYDRSVLERDLDRIERWYRARGYYQARVTEVTLTPKVAARSDRVPAQRPVCRRTRRGRKGCEVNIHITVEEGEPVQVSGIAISGADRLPRRLQERLRQAVTLKVGERFDEALYDAGKDGLQQVLVGDSYARANVAGEVHIDPDTRKARIEYRLEPGPACVYGRIRVEGNEHLPKKPILGAAGLRSGRRYKQGQLDDAQRAIFALGAFSTVSIEPELDSEQPPHIIDITIHVSPGRLTRLGFGGGVQSGHYIGFSGFEQVDVAQWDVHLIAVAEHRNFLGGLRRLRVEERPRYIFQNVFPRPTEPRLGNLATIEFRQPAFVEPRTTLVTSVRSDLGPDPFGARFFRHEFDARLAPERYFWDGRILVVGGIHGNVFSVLQDSDRTDAALETPSNYTLMFFEQSLQIDLRDNPQAPRQGAFFGMDLHEAGFILPGSWDYLRVTPEFRAYAPLPYGMVLAGRFALGAMYVLAFDDSLDTASQIVGPYPYRLRGGGASSHRGFLPGQLGIGLVGGLRRWEGSVELRLPLTPILGVVFFGDFGDVNEEAYFRFHHLNTAVGGGLRLRTPFGTFRFDMAGLVRGAQQIGPDDEPPRQGVDLGFASFAGAWHLTIGEAF
ncbi:MAG: BamA/OMP85 family outer membrane protein [Polyangiales bacterium]